ncbi:MAG: hypothetical protein WCP08_11475 [Prolixibacteraceae bacterium]
MKIKGLLFTLTLMFAVFVQLRAASIDQKKLVGKWEYSAPTAPPSYTSGQVIFTQVGDKLKGQLVIEGQSVDFSSVTIKEDVVSVGIYLESTLINVNFKMVGDALEGKAETPDGPVALKAVKK